LFHLEPFPQLRGAFFCSLLLLLHDQGRRQPQAMPCILTSPEGRMSAELRQLKEWIPESMDPGTIFVLENQATVQPGHSPYVAVMSCPRCGNIAPITRNQLIGGETMICGGSFCSAEFRLEDEKILFRPPQ
jgi:hypothetical protein